MTFHTWCLYALAYLATTISPGPNVLLVIRNTVRYGRRGTAATIAGNLLSQLLIVMLVALGVGAVLAAMPPVFIAMKIAGALYLIHLGIRQWRGGNAGTRSAATPFVTMAPDHRKVFREAFFVSVGNPKTLIFFCAFMPQFIAHDRALPVQFAMMYATGAGIVALVHMLYAWSTRRLHAGFAGSRWASISRRATGLLFLAFGLRLLTARQT